jgi:hypothetical protein
MSEAFSALLPMSLCQASDEWQGVVSMRHYRQSIWTEQYTYPLGYNSFA